jgi:hypothetical protein
MAKRKKQSKVQKRALRRGNPAKRGKPCKIAKAAAKKRAKPKRAPAKKGRLPVGPAVETVAAEVVEQPAATDEASTPSVLLKRNDQEKLRSS